MSGSSQIRGVPDLELTKATCPASGAKAGSASAATSAVRRRGASPAVNTQRSVEPASRATHASAPFAAVGDAASAGTSSLATESSASRNSASPAVVGAENTTRTSLGRSGAGAVPSRQPVLHNVASATIPTDLARRRCHAAAG